eukprot:6792638-Prymnesium_polylepis.1
MQRFALPGRGGLGPSGRPAHARCIGLRQTVHPRRVPTDDDRTLGHMHGPLALVSEFGTLYRGSTGAQLLRLRRCLLADA